MKKSLLLLLSFCFLLTAVQAQEGTLENLQFDAEIEQGTSDLTFAFQYTASAAGTYEWQLIPALEDGSPDWGQANIAYFTAEIEAASDLTDASFTYSIDAAAALDTYTWAGKLTIDATDLAYNNQGNLVEIVEGDGGGGGGDDPAGSLSDLVYDAMVQQGQTSLTFTCNYTANQAGSIEWQLIAALEDGTPDWGQANFAFTTVEIEAVEEPTEVSFTYDVPADTPLGTYTWAGKVTLGGTDLGYNNAGNLVEVEMSVDVDDLTPETKALAVYPNPVTNLMTVSAEMEEIFEIYNATGQIIAINTERNTERIFDFSTFTEGVYFIKSNFNRVAKIVKK